MDQSRTDLMRLTTILQGNNLSTWTAGHASRFNFSEAMALEVIEEFVSSMYTIHTAPTIVLIVLYIPLFLISLLGNTLVVVVVLRNAQMRRVKYLFLLNVAAADLLVTVLCIPMLLAQIIFRLWLYGRVMCKLTGYVQGVGSASGILSLVALSMDRYHAIRAPHRNTHAAPVLATVWILAALFVAPLLYVRNVYVMHFDHFNLSIAYCVELWPTSLARQVYAGFLLVSTYLLPVLLMAACYIMIGRSLWSAQFQRTTADSSSAGLQGRKRAARMLAAVIGLFVVSWLPYNILSLYIDVNQHYIATQLLPFTVWFAHSHSAVNPFLFWFLNPSFRHCMRKTLLCGTRRHQHSTPAAMAAAAARQPQ